MVASVSRSLFFRADGVFKFAIYSYAKSKPVNSFQGRCSVSSLSTFENLGGTKDRLGTMGKSKKRKTVTCQWRPVSAQASSVEENLVKDANMELEEGGQVEEVNHGESTSVSNAQKVMKVGTSLFRFIKGKRGDTQRKIEEEMGVKIVFPSSKDEESVIIEGSSIDSVNRASEKIQTILDKAIVGPSLQYSHFISLPLAIHPELVDKLVNFQNSILGKNNASLNENLESDSTEDRSDNENEDQGLNKGQSDVAVEFKVGSDEHVKVDLTSLPLVSYAAKASKSPAPSDLGIDKSIFIRPRAFHLTILMLKLWNKERVNAASEVLKSVSSKLSDALDNKPVSIRLKGLACLKGSLQKARVLYATVEELGGEDRLLQACQVITNAFVDAGLVMERDIGQKLKLHATVMNTSHRRGKRRGRNDFFDARGINEQFGSEEWGEYLIREAHLSQRFVYDDNGYYHCCASIPFPESMPVD